MHYTSPDSFYKYGDTNKPQFPAPAVTAQVIASKTGQTNTINNQEETQKVPPPPENAVTSKDDLNARAANTYPVLHFAPQETLPGSFHVSSNQQLPGQYYPSTVSPFTPGQNINQIAGAPSMQFAPAALTCRIHDFQAEEPSESIALLQIYLKPNPHLHNSLSGRVPGTAVKSAGTFDVHKAEATGQMTERVLPLPTPWDWYQEQTSSGQQLYVNGVQQRQDVPAEDEWLGTDGRQVLALVNKQLLANLNKNELQAPGPKASPTSAATIRQQRRKETSQKQVRLDAVKAKLLQQYQSEAEAKQQRGKEGTASASHCSAMHPCAHAARDTARPTVYTRSADNISLLKQEDGAQSMPVPDPSNNKADPTQIPTNASSTSVSSDETHQIGGSPSKRTADVGCDNSSCPEEIVTYVNLQKGSTQESNINTGSTSYPEGIITYIAGSTANSPVADWRNNVVQEQHFNEESTKVVPNVVEKTSDNTDAPTTHTVSREGFSVSPLKTDSAEVPRSNGIPDKFSSDNPSRHEESEMTVTSWEPRDFTSLYSADTMTTSSLKFGSEAEGNREVDMTTEASLDGGSDSQTQDNNTGSSSTKTNGTDWRRNEDDVTAGQVTPSDILVTSVEYDLPHHSVLSEARINSDSHKMDRSGEKSEYANVSKSNTISKNAVGNDSFSEITERNLDFVLTKIRSRGSRGPVRKENKIGGATARKMFRSDILVSSVETSTFHENNDSATEVSVNSTEPRNSSNETLYLSEHVTGEAVDLLLASYNLITESAATVLPAEGTRNHVISLSPNYTKEELLSTGRASGHEKSFNNETKGNNSGVSRQYGSERMGHMKESHMSLGSKDANSSSLHFKKADVFMQDPSTDYTSTTSSDNTRGATEIRPPTEFAKREASKLSDEVSVTSAEGLRTNVSEEWSWHENTRAEGHKDSGFTPADILSTTNRHNERESQDRSQKNNRQMKSESGFPQTAKLLVGYSHSGSPQNSGANPTAMYHPMAPPSAMQFLVYANAQNPRYVGKRRRSGTLIYPSPITHYYYSSAHNSNSRSINENDGQLKTDETTNTQAEKTVNGHVIER
jgi:hypothetical protein